MEKTKQAAAGQPKVFVLDTSVLMHDPGSLEKFEDNIVVIPFCVIEELDNLKKSSSEKGVNSRLASRILDKYSKWGDLRKGVPTESGGIIFVDYSKPNFKQFPNGMERKNDNFIIAVANKWKKEGRHPEIAVVSKDTNLRIKAKFIGVAAQDYLSDKAVERIEKLYTGFAVLEISHTRATDFFQQLNRAKIIPADYLTEDVSLKNLVPNQCCFIKEADSDKHLLAIFKQTATGQFFKLVPKPRPGSKNEKKIEPINNEQAFAYALATDPEISLISMTGKAGTGKTLMALLAGNDQLDQNMFKHMAIYRAIVPLSNKDMGFLPGSLEEKFNPWLAPIIDNLSLILNGETMEKSFISRRGKNSQKNEGAEMKKGNFNKVKELLGQVITIEPLVYIRGRSIHHHYILVDETQNLTPHEIKTMITRSGVGTKMILTGDLAQIDNPYLGSTTNGLAHVVERFKGQPRFGHINLVNSERSELAELAANLL